MAAIDDDVITSWRDRVGTLRKRGQIGAAALTVVPASEIDVRRGRPLPRSSYLTRNVRSGRSSLSVAAQGGSRVPNCF